MEKKNKEITWTTLNCKGCGKEMQRIKEHLVPENHYCVECKFKPCDYCGKLINIFQCTYPYICYECEPEFEDDDYFMTCMERD